MKDNWSDPSFAADWDAVDSRLHPTRREQLDILTSIIAQSYVAGDAILDVGCGSGQVEELIFAKCPEARIAGIDSSPAMLKIARQRLTQFGDNFVSIEKDIGSFEPDDLPKGSYRTVFSVQVLHELNTSLRRGMFGKIHALLPEGGQFLIMDRIKTDLQLFESPYKAVWSRLEAMTELKSAGTFAGYQQRIREKQDDPASLEEFQSLLEETGFSFAIMHLHFDRALIAAIKR